MRMFDFNPAGMRELTSATDSRNMTRPGLVGTLLFALLAASAAIESVPASDTNLNVISADSQCLSDLAGSSLTCSGTDVSGLAVPLRTVEVRKLLNPQDDAGVFDLTIDLITLASGVGDGGTTGPVEIALENSTALVGELGASNTLVSDYDSSIECLDHVGRCSLDADMRCTQDSSCASQSAGICILTPSMVTSCTNCTSLSVPIPAAMATIACTISNTAILVPDCNDQNPCTIDVLTVIEGVPSCSNTNGPAFTACGDPDATGCNAPNSCNASGQCIDRVDPLGTQCRSSSGECDTPEFCDGVSKACPADSFVPPGDECLLFRDGFEVPPDGLGFGLFKSE